MRSLGLCKSVPLQVGKDTFSVDLYMLPLEGFDIVLGVKWLRTLGPIIWDFRSLMVKFVLAGKEVLWRGHPLESKPEHHLKLAAYERELIGLAKAVIHWRSYLSGRHFLIRTDHYSLKYLLEQRITTSPQQHWISKPMGFDFPVEFKAGHLNRAADALSYCHEEEPIIMALSTWEPAGKFLSVYPTFELEDKLNIEKGSDERTPLLDTTIIGSKY
ncbi:hypothetical protein ZIOFF_058913 [Zingiber officinale]|uniref:Reverse transcriptase RNase H-like domain-containing protein n=1 Tax=Zingiber officinale TaxID=94328 RepID=A0A8J5KJR7_ZINOF|nr:hypothetical protein ZIOFF_058913 [Zingiber officinale]